MDIKAIHDEARSKFNGYCRVCKECNGRVCAGEVPGMGGSGKGISFINNVTALNDIKVNLRTIHDAKTPNTETNFFGVKLSLPVVVAPMTGISYNMGGALSEQEFTDAVVKGSFDAGTLAMTGDGADPAMYDSGIRSMKELGGRGIPVIKPRAQQEILRYLSKAEEIDALAVGIDVDGAGLVTMALKGQPVGPKTLDELSEIISAVKVPFILKGIMTPDEAVMAVKAGASAIVVSNHGGRVLDDTPGVAEVLHDIVSAVDGQIVVFADGGVRSGIDVLKYLALGADAVLVGRPAATAAYGGGAEGVKLYIEKLRGELFQTMILTGCRTIKDINAKVLHDY